MLTWAVGLHQYYYNYRRQIAEAVVVLEGSDTVEGTITFTVRYIIVEPLNKE